MQVWMPEEETRFILHFVGQVVPGEVEEKRYADPNRLFQ